MLHNRISLGTRKVSPPQPTCMTDDQKAIYLSNLRNNRPARPGGARPLPGRPSSIEMVDSQSIPRSGSALSSRREEGNENGSKRSPIPNLSSIPSLGTLKGRPLVQAPSAVASLSGGNTLPVVVQQAADNTDCDSLARELEKQEAHSLRQALEKIDHTDEESRIYAAAQLEAADLVWKHINPQLAEQEKTSAYKNPDLAKGTNHAIASRKLVATQMHHMDSQKSIASIAANFEDCQIPGLKLSRRGPVDRVNTAPTLTMHSNRRQSSGKRTVSNGSSKGVFRNPEDQIYEEPMEMDLASTRQAHLEELPLQSRPRNPVLRGSRPLPEKTYSVPLPERSKFDRFEIHKNAPSQSRKADYTANSAADSREATPEVETPKGRAMEIRSDEIRAATSMRRKDRSPKLPTPTAVSDRPGRPIVSFDPTWRAGTESPKNSLDLERTPSKPVPPLPMKVQSAPTVPTINLPDDDIPSISLPDDDNSVPSTMASAASLIPTISLPEDDNRQSFEVPVIDLSTATPIRPLPHINKGHESKPKPRPLPSHTQSSPARFSPSNPPRSNRVPWLSRGPTTAGATVTCNACQLPIAGRIVTASGSIQGGPKARFHPECFTCFHCSTALECVSFYPEPESAREERLEQDQQSDPAEMRFFCHLDFHDLFSPRCASCKTPIEGAVILAAGKSWHEGHFFCAECGDPFSSSSPFVEDKGYAYCVCCHTKRTSARCRGCKKQILDEVSVEALGGKWHEDCFRCDECAGDFGDDGQFFVREVEVGLTEKERRRGVMAKKYEERAVCHGCEELRLRRVDAFL